MFIHREICLYINISILVFVKQNKEYFKYALSYILLMNLGEEEGIKATILYHLRRKKIIGGVHTHYDTLKKGFPSHFGKNIDNVIKGMIKDNLLIIKPTSYGLQVSLNKERLKEIEGLILKVMGIKFN